MCLCGAVGRKINREYVATSLDAQIDGHYTLISSRISGLVRSVQGEEHQYVHKGDLLCTIDDREYRARVNQARARLGSNLARLRKARADWERAQKRFLGGVVSDSFRDQALARLKQSISDVDRSQADLRFAEIYLEYTRIVAPSDGTLSSRVAEPGMTVRDGTPLFGFVDASDRWVEARFREQDLRKIRVGQVGEIWLDSRPGKSFEGRVLSISPATQGEERIAAPDYATGLFTKYIQWVRMKVLFTSLPESEATRLPVGTNARVRFSSWGMKE